MSYRVEYERGEDGIWLATVPEVPGCHTQGKSVAQARERVREALGLFIDNADKVELEDHIKLSAELRQVVKRFRLKKAKIEALQAQAQAAAREAVSALKKGSFTVRDAGEVLEISHQRVQQLLGRPKLRSSAPRPSRRAVTAHR